MNKYFINNELDGIEISFEEKPNAATLDALKAAGFRWHRVKKVWYAKQTAERLALAQELTDGASTAPTQAIKEAAPVKYNLDNLGQNTPHLHGAELAAAIREDLKRRGVKGVTVRSRSVTYDTGITVTVKATAADIVSIEEYQKRYSFDRFSCDAMNYHGVFCGSKWIYAAEWEAMTEEDRRTAYHNHTMHYLTKNPDFYNYHQERKNYPTMTTDFYNKLVAVFKIANQWNYNNSDPMTDYFDVGYYLDIDIKIPEGFAPAEKMTDEAIRAYEAEKAAEEAAKAAEMARIDAELKQREEEARKYREWEATAVAGIYSNVTVEDLTDNNALYITGLMGGAGKESAIDELKTAIAETIREPQEAKITRKITFTSATAFADFEKLFLCDFDFLEGKGGTATEDERLSSAETYSKLTAEQREQIKFYINDAVAVYFGDELKIVIDPEGYSYARYVYIPTDASRIADATEALKAQADASASLPPFYIPAPVEEQAEALEIGQAITVYQCDGWILNNIYAGAGIIADISAGRYAQHSGVWITLQGKKPHRVFIHNGRKCLIYDGIKSALPEHVTRRRINERMAELYNADTLLKNTIEYYKAQGVKPIVNTCAS